MIASDGDSRRSSVRALNVRPHTPIVLPSTSPPAASTTFPVTRSNCSSLTAMTPSQQVERVAGVVGDLEQRPRVLREAGTAPPGTGSQEVLADALVVARGRAPRR